MFHSEIYQFENRLTLKLRAFFLNQNILPSNLCFNDINIYTVIIRITQNYFTINQLINSSFPNCSLPFLRI